MGNPDRPPQKKALLIASKYIYNKQSSIASNVDDTQAAEVREGASTAGLGDLLPRRANLASTVDPALLVNPCRDAWKWKKLLIDIFGFSENRIRTLVDEEHDCPQGSTPCPPPTSAVGLDEVHQPNPRMRPKKVNILRELHELVRDAVSGDTLFLFLAGHVNQLTCDEHTEADGQDEAFIPSDAFRPWECLHIPSVRRAEHSSWLKDNDLKKILVDTLPKGVRLVCVVDACHSGTLFDLPHGPCNAIRITANRRPRTYLTNASYRPLSRQSSNTQSLRQGTLCKNVFCSRRQSAAIETAPRDLGLANTLHSKENLPLAVHTDQKVPQRRSSTHDSCAQCSCFPTRDPSHSLGAVDANSSPITADSETETHICESPTIMSSSISLASESCGEWCRPDPSFAGSHVVTISACMDDQEAWENQKLGGTLTQVLVPFLAKNPKPTYRALMTHTSSALDKIVHKAHDRYRRKRDAGISPQTMAYQGPGYQDPQLCSTAPLDLDQPFIL
ncbi:peptidase C14, caspase domain-containing protein [Fomitopsis serialis]|uniref:peptidase C14, caspase domain-containing protein n=1 Tax=Fomitopsis serialis TaxID=139415 RepID=UPI002007900A|nr:peptidase C14, caspase domain-containing protein [Neoantrodia serialis]KAH9932853.1 peptidase C14, caspase domain-containing protein [Neoantrodia serialis]